MKRVKLGGIFDKYSIGEDGTIMNDNTGHIKKTWINNGNGYEYVSLTGSDGKDYHKTVHRLYATAFIPNPDNLPTVDHKDGNRTNNSLDNLRWASYSQNNSRFDTIGVRSETVKVTHYNELRNKRGGGHIEWLEPDSEMIFDRVSDVANHFGVTLGNISMMLKQGTIGRRGKMRGYKFEYVNRKGVTTIESGTDNCV